MGYLNNEQATLQAFDSEGFFHTGDSGYLEEETGNLVITGRIKELIITSGGENVAPVPIEMTIKDKCPILSNCIVVGEQKGYLCALLTFKTENQPQSQNLAPDVILYLLTKLNSLAKTT